MARIMVVDDEKGIRYILRALLERASYEVIDAESGESCLEKFDETRPDLVFMDIMMPGLDGWETCRRIKERTPRESIPVAMLSVRSDGEDVTRSLEYAGADAHIPKPIDMEEVLETAKRLLGKSRSSKLN